MLSDFHVHTCVSDGELDPPTAIRQAAAHGVRRVSLTDHDSLGAYRWGDGEVFVEAQKLGVELVVGIELDVLLEGREVHLLGYDLDLSASRLGEHLEEARQARLDRFRREIAVVRRELGDDVLRDEEVLVPGRETLMRPHLIRPLLDRGCFATYTEGRAWFHAHMTEEPGVPKPALEEALVMFEEGGGWGCLAHPGYYWKDGFPVLEHLPVLRRQGLAGVELEYPYHSSSPDLFTREDEAGFRADLEARGNALGLRFTRGSDAHFARDFDRIYGAAGQKEQDR